METNEHASLTILEKFNAWIQDSIMIKLFSIGFLILILLIPSAWISELINERQLRADEVIDEVSGKWSGNQTICGPMLVIPYTKQEVIDKGKDQKEIREFTEKAFFLPEQLDITGKVNPQILHRGIFDAVVYESELNVNSVFSKPDFKSLAIASEAVLWKDAYFVFGITDLRGISDNPAFTSGDQAMATEPSNDIGVTVRQSMRDAAGESYQATPSVGTASSNGIVSKAGWENATNFTGNIKMKLKLKGSQRLDFVPAGKTTTVKIESEWNNPSFVGEFLPASREVTEKGFSATWKVLHFNRPLPQQWTQSRQELSGADFGIKLLIPVDQYQKSIRTAKYGALIILLTFMALFLVEITQKIRIHPFQYILIGAALTIYYTLLLSFSEQIGYNAAYILSSIVTVALITFYSRTFFTQPRLSALVCVLLIVFYSFIYVIILQQDFSLLLGSIGLFIIVATLMYFSRNVKWYSGPAAVQRN
jgi:inner membrane protein